MDFHITTTDLATLPRDVIVALLPFLIRESLTDEIERWASEICAWEARHWNIRAYDLLPLPIERLNALDITPFYFSQIQPETLARNVSRKMYLTFFAKTEISFAAYSALYTNGNGSFDFWLQLKHARRAVRRAMEEE